jgi:DNA-binding transcriptional LysR family regulator
VRCPQLNPQHIVSFYYVAKEGSFTQAAEKLGITQSAVTQQMKSLEDQFRVKLFVIRKQKPYLTLTGEKLLTYADEFIHQTIMMETFLKSYKSTTLRVGIAGTILLYMMPLIDKFKELHPFVQVSVKGGLSPELLDELLKFRHDICFVGRAFLSSFKYPSGNLTVYRIPEVERISFVASPQYPVEYDAEISWEELAHQPLIIQTEGSTIRRVVLGHFKKRGLTPMIGTEVDNIRCARELARQRKGVAPMFWPNVKDDVATGKLRVIKVEDGDIRLGIDILLNREIALSQLARDLILLFEEHFGSSIRLAESDS